MDTREKIDRLKQLYLKRIPQSAIDDYYVYRDQLTKDCQRQSKKHATHVAKENIPNDLKENNLPETIFPELSTFYSDLFCKNVMGLDSVKDQFKTVARDVLVLADRDRKRDYPKAGKHTIRDDYAAINALINLKK